MNKMMRCLRETMIAGLLAISVLGGCGGSDQPSGEIAGSGKALDELRDRDQRRTETARQLSPKANVDKRILFGDLHVHTTYSIDGMAMEMPVMAQQGFHPPPDACDFARYCADLDFFSFNDHAENLTEEHWRVTKETVRQCNASVLDPDNPDLVAFAGWEWTQVGTTPESHWGHKNVIFPGTAEDELPSRPITARPRGSTVGNLDTTRNMVKLRFIDPLNWRRYSDLGWLLDRIDKIPDCPPGLDGPDIEGYCNEVAETPADLFRKLNRWGFDNLVIPHGNTWGIYTPPGASWGKQLNSRQHKANQGLLEVMSGHGNSEEYRSWRHVNFDAKGEPQCPAPTADFTPCCWQAGEIMRQRCDGLSDEECNQRVSDARDKAVRAGPYPHAVFPDATVEDWGACGQCLDCFKPSLSLRPASSAQYAMAISNFEERDDEGRPLRFKWGFIASTDDHTARPGTGYKQYERRKMTFATGLRSEFYARMAMPKADDPQQPETVDIGSGIPDFRSGSFSYPGGIVAVHSDSRRREDIWAALKRREAYGTSGPRMLLWFDLINDEQTLPMGSEATLRTAPRFRVRAGGDFVQKPGCPAPGQSPLSSSRMDYLCAGECYHPDDQRHPIERIEVVRITPQRVPGEPVEQLIEDPWKVLQCPPSAHGCIVEFEDETFSRDSIYYVRALQSPTPAINGDPLRVQSDGSTSPCYGDYRTDFSDDCLAPVHERAWSSPIFINHRQ